MTEHPSRELGLGHLGLASYDTTEKAWSLARDGFSPSFISLIGRSNVLIRSEGAHFLHNRDGSHHDSHVASASSTHLKQSQSPKRPALVALEKLYRSDERVSSTLLQATENYDPLKGDLLALGALTGHDTRSHRVLGLVTGPNGSSLRVIVFGEASHATEPDYENGLPDNLSLKSLLPTDDEGRWVGPGMSIQQVCFSHIEAGADATSSGRGARGQDVLIAVRMPTSIMILEPKLLDAPVTRQDLYTGKALPMAMLDLNLVMQINAMEADDCLYTDVSFNPWYNKQLVIADSRGHVTVIELEWKKRRNVWTSRTVYTLLGSSKTQNDPKEAIPDEWTRVLWIADVNTIAICTRLEIRLVDMSTLDQLPVPKLRSAGSITWTLDVRRHPVDLDQLFVLTSTTLLWFRVVSAQQSGSESSMSVGANLLATHSHFRDPMDVTLQMTVHIDGDQVVVLIYSRLNDGVTIVRFAEPEDISEQPRMTCSTSKLPIHNQETNAIQSLLGSLTSVVIPASISSSDDVADSNDVRGSDINCLQLLTLRQDLSVLQSYVGFTTTETAYEACQRLALDPTPSFKESFGRHGQAHKSLEYVSAEDQEDFVVADGGSDATYERQQTSEARGRVLAQKSNKHSPRFEFPRRSYATLLEIIKSTAAAPETSLTESSAANMIELLHKLQDLPLSDSTAGNSLYDLGGNMPADEISNTSTILEQLFANVNLVQENTAMDTQIEADALDRFCDHLAVPDDERSFKGVYRYLLGLFMMPLPQRAPARFRVSLGKAIKQVSMDLILAGARVTARTPEPPGSGHIIDPGEGNNESTSVDLPTHPTDKMTEPYTSPVERFSTPLHSEEYFQSSQPLPSQAYPTPSISVPPSPYSTTGSISSSFSTTNAATTNHNNRSDFLSNYVSFSDPITIRPPRSATSRLLQHWEPGTDPDDYIYSETQMALDRARDAAEQAEAMRGMTGSQRRKMARRAQRKQERNFGVNSSQHSVGGSSRASSVIPATQPLPSIEEQNGQSSQIQSQEQRQLRKPPDPFGMSSQIMTTASQREPGRFGGRPPLRKKKKVSGF